jgi:beta-N-acetylhexosaminidase
MNGVLARVRPTGALTSNVGSYGAIDSPGLAEVTKQAIVAGNGVLLMPLDVTVAINAVVDGVREGRFTQARVDSSARRILMYKRAVGLDRNRFVSADSARKVVGVPANLAVADRIAERSVTLAKDSAGLVPLNGLSAARPRVLSITISSRADLGAGATFDTELRRFVDVRSDWIDAADPGAGMARVTAFADSIDYVIVGSYVGQGTRVADVNAPLPLVELVRALVQRNSRTIVVAFGNPYFYQQIPFVPTYLLAWSGFPPSQRAAARALVGAAPISGRLPVSIPPALRLGGGELREPRTPR